MSDKVELEFEYPSQAFFNKIEEMAKNLSLTELRHCSRHVERSGVDFVEQSLPELLIRLKKEVATDFEQYLDEAESVPYTATYVLTVERGKYFSYVSVNTALKSKNGHTGKVLYGVMIFRIAADKYLTEKKYGG